MSSPKKRTPSRTIAGEQKGGTPQTADKPVEFSVVETQATINNDRALLAPVDMTAYDLLPDDPVLLYRGTDCIWRGRVWPHRSQETGTLALPVRCAQIADTSCRLRLVMTGTDKSPAVVSLTACSVGFAHPTPGPPISAAVLQTLRVQLSGCIVTSVGLVWVLNGTSYHIASADVSTGGREAYFYVDETTVFRWQPSLELRSPSCAHLGGLQDYLKSLCTLVSGSLSRTLPFQLYGLRPTRYVRSGRLWHPLFLSVIGISHRGALITGPSGTGKSSLAAAVARETGATAVYFDCGKCTGRQDSAATLVEQLLTRAFRAAADTSCLLILEDVDLIFSASSAEVSGDSDKGSFSTNFSTTALVAILVDFFDRFDAPSSEKVPLFVLGTTRRPGSVDPRLRRAGRFEVEVALEAPSRAQRSEILRSCLSTCGSASRITGSELDDIASRANGYVGADLRMVCSEAAMSALRRHVLHGVGKAGEVPVVDSSDLAAGLRLIQVCMGRVVC